MSYVFISYSHKDKKSVLKEISKRESQGQQFWYDKGIDVGDDWAASIGNHLADASSMLYFSSKYSAKSENCQRELAFAKEHNIPIETVVLKSKSTGARILAAVFIVVLSLFLMKVVSGSVPNVIGSETVSGKQTIEDSGFDCNLSYNYSDDLPLGIIMDQSSTGIGLKFIPVTITQSLGREANLVLMPDTVNSYISDGVKMLIDAGIGKFTITAGVLGNNKFGYITAQTAPAGYMISSENTIGMTVAKDDNPLQFELNGYLFTLTDELTFDIADLPKYGLTEAEWQLFQENNKHSIFAPNDYENVWLPAQNEAVILENPNSCYGWVVVRDSVISADQLFDGYSELYVCPGITLTVKGNETSKDRYADFYVAKGGTLIFEDEVDGGVYLVNDGTTVFKKNVGSGTGGVLLANRGSIQVAGTVSEGVTIWSFYESSLSISQNSSNSIHDYSKAKQMNANHWYEGCSGENGVGMILGKLEVFESYDQSRVGSENNAFGIAPVIIPEDYEEHYQEEFYANNYLFLIDYTVSKTRQGRGQYWGFIVPSGVTVTIDDEQSPAAVFVDDGGTVIINGDLPAHWPYCDYLINDGTMIINGDLICDNADYTKFLIMNRGSLTINGRFGGQRMLCYNFEGASFRAETTLTNTHLYYPEISPNYVFYGNSSSDCAVNYVDEYLHRYYGYEGWHIND